MSPEALMHVDQQVFSQRQAVALTQASNATLDNWVVHGHIHPLRDGDRRFFSLVDLVTVEVLHMLAFVFEMKPKVGRTIALAAVMEWRPHAVQEVARIAVGSGVELERRDFQFTGFRETTEAGKRGELREAGPGDDPASIVTVVLPVATLARRVIAGALAMEAAHGAS